jgi:hypothetical protein
MSIINALWAIDPVIAFYIFIMIAVSCTAWYVARHSEVENHPHHGPTKE